MACLLRLPGYSDVMPIQLPSLASDSSPSYMSSLFDVTNLRQMTLSTNYGVDLQAVLPSSPSYVSHLISHLLPKDKKQTLKKKEKKNDLKMEKINIFLKNKQQTKHIMHCHLTNSKAKGKEETAFGVFSPCQALEVELNIQEKCNVTNQTLIPFWGKHHGLL